MFGDHSLLSSTCSCYLVLGSAVQLATWVKKTFALRPALNRIRRQRPEQRDHQSDQVDGMF